MIFATLILWASISMLDIGIGIALPVVSVAFGVLWYYGGDRLIFIVAVMVVVVSLALYLSSYVKQREAPNEKAQRTLLAVRWSQLENYQY